MDRYAIATNKTPPPDTRTPLEKELWKKGTDLQSAISSKSLSVEAISQIMGYNQEERDIYDRTFRSTGSPANGHEINFDPPEETDRADPPTEDSHEEDIPPRDGDIIYDRPYTAIRTVIDPPAAEEERDDEEDPPGGPIDQVESQDEEDGPIEVESQDEERPQSNGLIDPLARTRQDILNRLTEAVQRNLRDNTETGPRLRGESILQHYIPPEEVHIPITPLGRPNHNGDIYERLFSPILRITTAQNASGPSHSLPPDFPEEIPQMPKKSKNTRYKLIKKAARETAKKDKSK